MDDPGGIILKLILLLLLILVNAFFAMSEIAVISLNDNKIEKMAEDGHKKAKQVVKLTENSSKFLSTIQIGVTLAGFLTSASASQTFADMIVKALKGTAFYNALGASVVSGLSIVIITIIMSYFSLVLGELAPKKIAMQSPEKISFKVVGILLFFSKAFSPFVKVLSVSTNAVVRLLGYNPHADEEPLTEEEIRMMVDVGGEKGVIEDVQKEMINNIFEFDDLDAGDIMTHRTDMTAVDRGEDRQVPDHAQRPWPRQPHRARQLHLWHRGRQPHPAGSDHPPPHRVLQRSEPALCPLGRFPLRHPAGDRGHPRSEGGLHRQHERGC